MAYESQSEDQIKICLFDNVENVDEVLSLQSLECSNIFVVDLGNVLNGFHLSYAALRVLMNESQGKLKTKQNNDTEFKYYLSFSCKISECVRQYTPTSSSRQIGIVTCHSGDINQFNHIISKVSGTKISEESFASSTYLTAEKEQSIKSSFKISPTEAGSLESIIISKIAVKDI